MHGCVLMNNFIITAKQIIMLCSKFTQLEMLVKIAHCSQVMARLEDTEKRHNTHMVRTIRVCLYRTHMPIPYAYGMENCTVHVWYIPYAYGTKYTYGIEQLYCYTGVLRSFFFSSRGACTPCHHPQHQIVLRSHSLLRPHPLFGPHFFCQGFFQVYL